MTIFSGWAADFLPVCRVVILLEEEAKDLAATKSGRRAQPPLEGKAFSMP
jgi:hypothetical protein